MVLAAYEYVEVRGSGSQSTSRPWPVTSSEWSGHGLDEMLVRPAALATAPTDA